jgi:hypothetical protein
MLLKQIDDIFYLRIKYVKNIELQKEKKSKIGMVGIVKTRNKNVMAFQN